MIRHRYFLSLALVVIASFVSSGCSESEAAPVPDSPPVNQPAPAFSVIDTKGKTHTLDSYRGKWVVLEWFNHDCPYTKKHYKSDNMQALQRDYTAKGVVWISVLSSAPGKQGYRSAADADEETSEKKAAPSFVVRDTAGVLGRQYGARNTPHIFAIDPQGVLQYAGAIDDRPTAKASDVKGAKNYLKAALDAGLAGKPIAVATTQPYGCDVKY